MDLREWASGKQKEIAQLLCCCANWTHTSTVAGTHTEAPKKNTTKANIRNWSAITCGLLPPIERIIACPLPLFTCNPPLYTIQETPAYCLCMYVCVFAWAYALPQKGKPWNHSCLVKFKVCVCARVCVLVGGCCVRCVMCKLISAFQTKRINANCIPRR